MIFHLGDGHLALCEILHVEPGRLKPGILIDVVDLVSDRCLHGQAADAVVKVVDFDWNDLAALGTDLDAMN